MADTTKLAKRWVTNSMQFTWFFMLGYAFGTIIDSIFYPIMMTITEKHGLSGLMIVFFIQTLICFMTVAALQYPFKDTFTTITSIGSGIFTAQVAAFGEYKARIRDIWKEKEESRKRK